MLLEDPPVVPVARVLEGSQQPADEVPPKTPMPLRGQKWEFARAGKGRMNACDNVGGHVQRRGILRKQGESVEEPTREIHFFFVGNKCVGKR